MAEVLNILSSTKSSGGKSRLSFPNKIYDDNTDYIKFDFYNYTGPFAQVSNSGTVAANGTKSPGSDPYNEYNGTEYTKYEFDGGNKTILMYMPEDIQAAYSANWGGKGFTNIAADALRVVLRSRATKQVLVVLFLASPVPSQALLAEYQA